MQSPPPQPSFAPGEIGAGCSAGVQAWQQSQLDGGPCFGCCVVFAAEGVRGYLRLGMAAAAREAGYGSPVTDRSKDLQLHHVVSGCRSYRYITLQYTMLLVV